jgi:hypothetical protein
MTITLTDKETTDLILHIYDGVLQDGWFEMEREEFDGWMALLRKLGSDPTHWERRYNKMEANLL